jgi:hypothetical protein
MGRKETFDKFIHEIDDDFLQRNEDIVFAELVNEHGEYGRIPDTFHYHQVMERQDPESSFGEDEPQITSVSIKKESAPEWERKVAEMQWKGIVRYTSPKPYLIRVVEQSILQLMDLNSFEKHKFQAFVQEENPQWENRICIYKLHIAKYILSLPRTLKSKIWDLLKMIYNRV